MSPAFTRTLNILCAIAIAAGLAAWYVISRYLIPALRDKYVAPLEDYAREVVSALERATGGRARFWILKKAIFYRTYDVPGTVTVPLRFEVQTDGQIPNYYNVENFEIIDPEGNGVRLRLKHCIPVDWLIETDSGVIEKIIFYVKDWYKTVAKQVKAMGLGTWLGAKDAYPLR